MPHGEITPLDLPGAMPPGYGNRLFLYAMRRMASAGVDDAHAANPMLGAFGRSDRRPLVPMRAALLLRPHDRRRSVPHALNQHSATGPTCIL